MKNLGLTVAFLCTLTLAFAQETKQKIGHLNTGNLMEILPEIKNADSLLTVYQDSLQKIEDDMIAAFEKEYTEFAQLAQAGELTQITIKKKQEEFQAKEQQILELRKESQLNAMKKRQELMTPIMDKLQKAIDEVAKEGNFSYIMDVGSGSLLYANESEDIEELVKKKLGVAQP